MKEKLEKWMSGRYGADELSKACIAAALICIIFSWFFLRDVLIILAAAGIGVCYFRMLSRNITARRKENLKYLKLTNPVRQWLLKQQRDMRTRRTHHLYRCPECGQRIRIPRGKGRICITCPRCKKEFTKRS